MVTFLFAKKLVHETTMSMAEVAHAAGFGSLRRFNETFRKLYGRPRSALRRKRSLEAPGAITLSLGYAPPYDWPAMRAFIEARAIADPETIQNRGRRASRRTYMMIVTAS